MPDYIVVGAGTAGCVLALRLTEDPASTVLLLEAGGPDTRPEIHTPSSWNQLISTDVDWGYLTEPQPDLHDRVIQWPRGKVLGGTSSINAMMYVRGNAYDYDHWAALGNDGWNYRAVLPYFKKSEHQGRGGSDYHGAGGPLSVSDPTEPHTIILAAIAAAQEIGIDANGDFNGESQEGVGLGQETTIGGKRCSAAIAFLHPVMARENLTVETTALVTRVLLDGTRATGVEYVQNGAMHESRADGEVILCGGAVNSPQLLMLSGIGAARHLGEVGIPVSLDLPGVGRNLQDHLSATIDYRSRQAGQIPESSIYVQGDCFVSSRPDHRAPDLQIIFGVWPGARPGDPLTCSLIPILLRPESRGTIRLASDDPFAPPLIQPRYLSAVADLEVLVEGVRIARRIGEAPALAAVLDAETVPGSWLQSDDAIRSFVRERASTVFHPVGTCTMGTDPLAVVDDRLRVHGVQRLRVADASIMPTLVSGNTNAPVMMIAEKGADLIKQDAHGG